MSNGGERFSESGGSPLAVQLTMISSPFLASIRSLPDMVGGAGGRMRHNGYDNHLIHNFNQNANVFILRLP